MGIEFFEDKIEEHRWRVVHPEEDLLIHSCHEGFYDKHGALQNLFLNHAKMSNFIAGLAGNVDSAGKPIEFYEGKDHRTWWRITAANGEIIGASNDGFSGEPEAVDNLIMTYTMLAMFIAMHAQERNSR